uniref:Mono-ADP-ribosyltransferase 3 variant III n=1 Tax=Homo sapiens TaxID=9606 RepID=Q5J1L1_HUMAN|nr:mono-ADP-ribosyltransferase 3 variant III [Homo sapiens]
MKTGHFEIVTMLLATMILVDIFQNIFNPSMSTTLVRKTRSLKTIVRKTGSLKTMVRKTRSLKTMV